MPFYTYEELMRDLKNKVYQPVYLLQGEESFYIDLLSDYLSTHVLSEGEKEFNQTILYGRDTDLLSLVSAAKRYPMMANYQVVIVKEAQDIKNLVPRETKSKDKKSESDEKNPLLPYLQNPQKSTLLVFCYKYGHLDKRTRLGKAFEKSAAVFTAKKLYDNEVPGWIGRYVSSLGYRIGNKAAMVLSEHTGADLTKIVNELDKLMLNVKKETEINVDHIEQHTGISKEYNVFELQHALGSKNILKANRIVYYFAANTKNNPFQMTLANLFSYFNKIMLYHTLPDKSRKNASAALGVPEFFLPEYERASKNYPARKVELIFSHLHDYDMRSKGVGAGNEEGGELLKELVFKILH